MEGKMEKLKVNIQVDSDDELLEKMKEAYLNCPTAVKYCNDLKIPPEVIDENIVKVYDFVSDLNYCKKCPGVKNCQKSNPLLCTKIIYDHGQIDRQLVPCKELLKQITFKRQFINMDFDEEWLESTFRTVNQNDGRKKAFVRYNEFLKNKDNGWIYLTGVKNSGRSYFAATIAVDIARKNKGPICFLNSTLRLREINDLGYGKKKDEFDKKIELYSNVPVLVLDDFGNEFKNDFVRDAILFPILSTRAGKRLFTIFTSDFSIDEIETLYGTSKAGAIRAKQIARLIKSMSKEEINLGEVSIY